MNKILYFSILLFSYVLWGQTTPKEIKQQLQTWVSLNTITKYNDNWGIAADAHIRENGFFESNNFYFLRGGIANFVTPKITIIGGYAHMWLAPSNPDWSTYADENRIYEQFQLNTNSGKVGILQRLRIEQRWQEKIVNDEVSDVVRFTNRFRYLMSFTIPVFKKSTMPSLVLSDEILLHFGKEVVYNTFDQNRFFVGIKQSINSKLSFDFGYMNVYQQKYSGYQYDMNHTIRLFFYLNSNIKSKDPHIQPSSGDE